MTDSEFADNLRAVQALRTGLRAQAERPAFRPLDAAELARRAVRPPQTGRWLRVAAAVAAVAVAGTLIASQLGNSPITAVPAVTDAPSTVARQYGQWTKIAASPLSPRWEAHGTWVAGRYLVLGGYSDFMCPANAACKIHAWLTDGALYDPAANSWTTIAPLPVEGAGADSPVTLGSSVYLLADGSAKGSRELLRYDTEENAWTGYPVPDKAGDQLVATDSSLVLLSSTDEFGAATDEVFDPATGAFAALPDDPLGPSFDRSAVWTGDRLLLSAHDLVDNPGSEEPSLMRLAELDTNLTTWRDLGTTKLLGSAARSANGRVVWPSLGSADGGEVNNWGKSYDYGGIFDPGTGAWSALPTPPSPGGLAGSWLVAGERVEVDGQLLDPALLTWTTVPELPTRQEAGVTMLGGPDGVLAWGGGSYQAPTADGYLLWLEPLTYPAATPSAAAMPAASGEPSSFPPVPPSAEPVLADPPDGFRWERYDTVDSGQVVWLAVPDDWGRAASLDADYCFTEQAPVTPAGPYVDDNHGTSQGHAITCDPLNDSQQALHVSVVDPGATDTRFPWDGGTPGWRQWSTTRSGVTVTVTGQDPDEKLARQILDTVTVVAA